MSMEDILKVLVDSRQPTRQSQPAGGQDPMTALIGGLLGGGQSGGQSGGAGLGDMMGVLETIMGSGARPGATPGYGQGMGMGMQNPILALLQPTVDQLARKVNIPPEIAMLVVSFVVQKLLAHHPTSGRDSNQFDLDDVLRQLSAGDISQQTLQSSGLVNELSRSTGMDQEAAARSLTAAFGLVGGQLQGVTRGAAGVAPRPTSRPAGGKTGGGAKRRPKKRSS
jgi:hypothetical protein